MGQLGIFPDIHKDIFKVNIPNFKQDGEHTIILYALTPTYYQSVINRKHISDSIEKLHPFQQSLSNTKRNFLIYIVFYSNLCYDEYLMV